MTPDTLAAEVAAATDVLMALAMLPAAVGVVWLVVLILGVVRSL